MGFSSLSSLFLFQPVTHSVSLETSWRGRTGWGTWPGLVKWGDESEGLQVGLEGVALWVLTSDLSKRTGRFTVQGAACVAV